MSEVLLLEPATNVTEGINNILNLEARLLVESTLLLLAKPLQI
jgi:hypothetical protein